MIFARADEAYWSLFDSKAGTRLTDYAVSPIDEVLDDLAARDKGILFVGTGARRNWEKISSRLGDAAKLAPAWCDFARGAALIDLGTKRLMAGEDDNAMAVSPVYVRKPTPVIRLETGQL
jgi:tRNA A37 threonylcarbamoyladenosine modification protein TsaB